MDPISILTLVGSTTKVSWEIGNVLIDSVGAVRSVDENLKGFSREVDGLRRLLVSITTSLNDPALGLAEISNAKDANKDMWVAIYGAIEDCHDYLQKLRNEIVPLTKSDESKNVFSQAVRALKLHLTKDDINKIRSHVQYHQLGLSTSLQMLNVYVSCRLPMQMHDNLGHKIDGLGELMEKLQHSIDSRPKTDAAGSEATLGDKLESSSSASSSIRLKEAAAKVHSSASVVSAARSTTWGGSERYSILGDPLSEGSRNEIERWISLRRADTISEEPEHSTTPTTTDPLSNFSRDEPKVTESETTELETPESDSEDEIDFEVSKKLLAKGHSFFSHQMLVEAAALYEKALARCRNLRAERRSELFLHQVHLRLAWSYLKLADYENSKILLLKLTGTSSRDPVDSTLVLDATFVLSVLYLRMKKFEEAETHCRKALKGRKLIDGKGSPMYNEALLHLVSIHLAKSELEEAVAIFELLPANMRESVLKESGTSKLDSNNGSTMIGKDGHELEVAAKLAEMKPWVEEPIFVQGFHRPHEPAPIVAHGGLTSLRKGNTLGTPSDSTLPEDKPEGGPRIETIEHNLEKSDVLNGTRTSSKTEEGPSTAKGTPSPVSSLEFDLRRPPSWKPSGISRQGNVSSTGIHARPTSIRHQNTQVTSGEDYTDLDAGSDFGSAKANQDVHLAVKMPFLPTIQRNSNTTSPQPSTTAFQIRDLSSASLDGETAMSPFDTTDSLVTNSVRPSSVANPGPSLEAIPQEGRRRPPNLGDAFDEHLSQEQEQISIPRSARDPETLEHVAQKQARNARPGRARQKHESRFLYDRDPEDSPQVKDLAARLPRPTGKAGSTLTRTEAKSSIYTEDNAPELALVENLGQTHTSITPLAEMKSGNTRLPSQATAAEQYVNELPLSAHSPPYVNVTMPRPSY